MEEAKCLRIPKRLGNKALLSVKDLKLLDSRLVVKRDDHNVIIPISRMPTTRELTLLSKRLRDVVISTDRFVERRIKRRSLNEALAFKLSPKILLKLPRSMDIIGQVAIIEIPPELEPFKNQIGGAILDVHRNIKTVLAKASAVGGKHRLREFDTIGGTGETETLYKEHGCVYNIDPTKVYLSPRLSYEHLRIAKVVRVGEVIIDMFAGVGPFSILIAKRVPSVKVYAIEINPDAIRFLKRNVVDNKLKNVTSILGDVREVVDRSLANRADRVIMNLPGSSINFIDVACKALKLSGGVIHFYGFGAEPDTLVRAEDNLVRAITMIGRPVERVINSKLVRSTAPHEWQVAVDVLVA